MQGMQEKKRHDSLKAFGDNRVKISQEETDVSEMYHIKVVAMEPGVMDVLNDKPQIRRYPGLLDRA